MMLSAGEVATRLRDLAEAIEHGQPRIGQTSTPVSQTISFEQEYEQEHGRQELTIDLEWAA